MWWPGKRLREVQKELEELRTKEQERKEAVLEAKDAAAYKEKEDKQAHEYFSLPVFPSGRDCWACGSDAMFTVPKVKLTQDGTRNGFGYVFDEKYCGRRYLTVTCEQCGAVFHERMVGPTSIPEEKGYPTPKIKEGGSE